MQIGIMEFIVNLTNNICGTADGLFWTVLIYFYFYFIFKWLSHALQRCYFFTLSLMKFSIFGKMLLHNKFAFTF